MRGAFLENRGGTMVPFLGGIVIGNMSSPFYQYVDIDKMGSIYYQ